MHYIKPEGPVSKFILQMRIYFIAGEALDEDDYDEEEEEGSEGEEEGNETLVFKTIIPIFLDL